MAVNPGQLKRTYLIGGIAIWGSLTFISSLYLGRAAVVTGLGVSNLFTGPGAVLFAVTITFIGISTVAHYLMGMLGVFTTDYYRSFLRPKATEKQMLAFGRVMTVAIGIFCALVAISLENISLLTIDVFCAIFFAAPCGPLILVFLCKRAFGNLPIIATSVGIVGGIIVWVATPASQQLGQFLGMAVSLGIPLALMFLGDKVMGEKTRGKEKEKREK